MSLADLPHEIVAIILQTALDATTIPSDIFCVCRLFYDLGTDYLYTHIKFTSPHQLQQFVLSDAPQPPIAPRTLAVDLAGKAQRGVLRDLADALMKCQQLARVAEATSRDVRLKRLRLRMHSYAQDSAVDVLEQGLDAVSPDTFEWTGPDPDHHFSIAIVPTVASCLFKQFSSWCNIREITVTNISFTTCSGPGGLGEYPPLLGGIPSLRSLYIGQATFLHAHAVAGMFCQGSGMAHLALVRLVDAYPESIWGARLRRSDIVKAVTMLCRTEELQMSVIARVKGVVTCEKKTERIMGGDRVEGTHILE
ncbi:hypothetical protein OG21DRAFT_951105 [Imleria badia]|nr:hypothetical protein OG21DRAFT_951105 [Imleria badia]